MFVFLCFSIFLFSSLGKWVGRDIEWARFAQRKQPLVIFVTKSSSGLTILNNIYTKNILPFLKFKPYWQTQFYYRHWNLWWLLPTSAVWTVLNDLIWYITAQLTVVRSCKELQNIWLTVPKKYLLVELWILQSTCY